MIKPDYIEITKEKEEIFNEVLRDKIKNSVLYQIEEDNILKKGENISDEEYEDLINICVDNIANNLIGGNLYLEEVKYIVNDAYEDTLEKE